MKSDETTPTYFVWYPIVGTVFKIKSKDLTVIVDIMGRSVLALDMAKLEAADRATTPKDAKPAREGIAVP